MTNNLKDEIEGILREHSYKQDVRDFGKPATVTQYKKTDLVEALTSLIQQNLREFVKRVKPLLNTVIAQETLEVIAEQFLKESTNV